MGDRTAAERADPGRERDAAFAETLDGASGGAAPGGAAPEGAAAEVRVAVRELSRIGRYVILRRLGQGGMGVVYSAYDEELDRKVAVKLLHHAEVESAERRARVLREAQAMARVSHPNVLTVYEVGQVSPAGDPAGQVFIAMEFIEGSTLHDWQKQEGRTWDEILHMYLAAGQGLHAAHSAGLVHRDFKPDNVLVGPDQRPRVADFGLARAAGQAAAERPVSEPASPRALLSSPLTQDGALVGTPAYMSPEQYARGATDSRSDQFSFCAALYEALYKKLPFVGEDLAEFGDNVVHGRLRALQAESAIPSQVEQALRRGLSADPGQRFPSMAELLAALSPEVQHDPSGAPLARRVFTGSIAVLITLIAVAMNLRLRNGGMTPGSYVAASAALFAGVTIAALVLRRALRQNSFHRGLVRLALILSVQIFALRMAAVYLHMELTHAAIPDMLAVTAMLAVISAQYLPILWPACAVAALSTIVVVRRPDLTWTLMPLTYHVVGIAVILAWNRAANRIRPRSGSPPGSPLLSGSGASSPSGSTKPR